MKRIALLSIFALAACAHQKPEPLPTVSSMTIVTRLEYPKSAKTVQEAAEYILRPTGYHLVVDCPNCGPEAREIAEKPPSPLSLRPEITTIARALILIGGSRTAIVVDADHHAIAYTWAGSADAYRWAGAAR